VICFEPPLADGAVVQLTAASEVTAAVTVMEPNLVLVTASIAALARSPLRVVTTSSLLICSAEANGSGWTNILIGYSFGAAVALVALVVLAYNTLEVLVALEALAVALDLAAPLSAGLPREADAFPLYPP